MENNKKEKTSTFYDVKHSNNSARVRLWLRLHSDSVKDQIDTVLLGHDDLDKGIKLSEINPLKKIPAFITDTGLKLYESFVIISYLEDRYGGSSSSSDKDISNMNLVLDTPDDRAFVQLLVRIHDIYISSPNCTQPHFSHTQGKHKVLLDL